MFKPSFVLVLGLYLAVVWVAALRATQQPAPAATAPSALPPDATGEQIFRLACATCHAPDGTGSPAHVVGFDLPLPNGHDFPDFTDCPTNTAEPLADWVNVVTKGGPVRALDRRMPAFGDALSPEQIERVVAYAGSLCTDPAWPRGDLNLPRPLFTEKAYPENEAVWTLDLTASGAPGVSNELLYEHRIGARGQYEIAVPIDLQRNGEGGPWSRGLGDIEIAYKHAFHHDVARGRIAAAGAAVVLPTGKETLGLGNGYTVFEPFAMYGQILGSGFVQLHAGMEIPSDRDRGNVEGFFRTAVGYTLAQDAGFGRVWSPMAEVLVARGEGGPTEWDLVPQVQVSLSKLQHVLLNVGVRVPLNERQDRHTRFLTYVLWDWFDGGLFQFWK